MPKDVAGVLGRLLVVKVQMQRNLVVIGFGKRKVQFSQLTIAKTHLLRAAELAAEPHT
jgi:hypothetical protein